MLDAATEAMVEVVLPHDAGHAWVSQDVSIACLLSTAPWEGPVLLSATCTCTELGVKSSLVQKQCMINASHTTVQHAALYQ